MTLITFKYLLTNGFQLIKKDPIVLSPLLIYGTTKNIFFNIFQDALTKIIENINEHILLLCLLSAFIWISGLLFTGFSTAIMIRLHQKKDVEMTHHFQHVSRQFLTIVMGNFPVLIPIILLGLKYAFFDMGGASPSGVLGLVNQLVTLFLIIVMVSLYVYLIFVTLIILNGTNHWLSSIEQSVIVVKSNMRAILTLLLTIMTIFTTSMMLQSMFFPLPYLGNLMQIVIEGCFRTLNLAMITVFFFSVWKKKKV
ncbi:MAG: hypothetical protein HRT90_04010 [Candidatus Margulisbacteria bacterium]|nr:hypothetical protein [Candidatus Margulisiibacteriota bacterium]